MGFWYLSFSLKNLGVFGSNLSLVIVEGQHPSKTEFCRHGKKTAVVTVLCEIFRRPGEKQVGAEKKKSKKET